MSLLAELQRRNVLRVALAYLAASWLLIQIADTIFPLFGLPDGAARLVVVLLAIGFLPALVFSWVFELTPEGFKLDAEVERSESVRPATGRRLDRLIIIILSVALAYFAIDKFLLSPARVESAREAGRTEGRIESFGERSIAVLPFVDMSPAGDQGYMSDGIAEELLNVLAGIPELRVISRSSSFAFRDRELKLPVIAEQLNVTYILEGSVRRSGDRIRVTSQLIDARSDTHVWSQTYERELGDIFAIQDDIASTVVGNLKPALIGEQVNVQQADPEAYAAFLRARYLHENPTGGGFEEALGAYRQAVDIDPGYAPAWVWLAALYDDMGSTREHSYEEVGVLAKQAVSRALEIDPDYSLALAMRAIVTRQWDQDLASAVRDMQRAVDSNPLNPIVLRWAALLMLPLTQYEESVRLQEYLFARDPLGWITRFNLAVTYYYAGRYEQAIDICESLLTANSAAGRTRYILAQSLLFTGRADEAIHHAELQTRPERRHAITAMAAHALGERDVHEDALAALVRMHEEGTQEVTHEIAMVMAYASDADAAIEWLQRGFSLDTSELRVGDSSLPALHDDPRWDGLMRRVREEAGLTDFTRLSVVLPAETL